VNICTEELAKTKWCPMVRHDLVGDGAFNRTADDVRTVNLNCVASDCMAWRLHGYDMAREMWFGYCGAFGGPVAGDLHPQDRILKTRREAA
jgi:hypothetical protein